MDEISIFVSYCHDDDMWVKKGEHGLIPFLEQSLKRLGVRFWYDRALKGGDKWREEIKRHIDESRLAILLISQSFLNSEFIREHELPRIKARYDEGQLLMIPILVDHTDWESETQLGWITQLQMEPSDVTPTCEKEPAGDSPPQGRGGAPNASSGRHSSESSGGACCTRRSASTAAG
jgi:hypothetical protein